MCCPYCSRGGIFYIISKFCWLFYTALVLNINAYVVFIHSQVTNTVNVIIDMEKANYFGLGAKKWTHFDVMEDENKNRETSDESFITINNVPHLSLIFN